MHDPNCIGTDFFLNDVAVAHTFLDAAETTGESGQRLRYVKSAREALNTIDRYLDALDQGTARSRPVERIRRRLWMRVTIAEHRLPFGHFTHRAGPGRVLRGVKGHLQVRRVEGTTFIGFVRDDEHFAAIQIADDSDVETVAGQFRVLAESIARKSPEPTQT